MSNVNTTYGDGLIDEELKKLGNYVAVVDPVAWDLCENLVTCAPVDVLVPSSLEESQLDQLGSELISDTHIVAIGGGMVVDAGKYLALKANSPVTLAPSISSSNAPFSDFISVRNEGQPTGMLAPEQTKRVIVDFDLITRASPRLNRAGFADLLAHEIAMRDWEQAAEAGRATVNVEARHIVSALTARCRDAASSVGRDTRDGLEFIMRTFDEMTVVLDRFGEPRMGAGSEHLLAWTVEAVTGRHFVHGEVVALGIVVAEVAFHGDGSLAETLDNAGVQYRLGELGLSWEEFETALRTVDDYNRRVRRFDTVFTDYRWTNDSLRCLRARLTE